MTKIKPHVAFDLIRPDEVAECWDGVYSAPCALYEALWDCTEAYDDQHLANIEDMGPHDVIGINCVKQFWKRFTPEQQAKLNELAEEQDAKWKELSA